MGAIDWQEFFNVIAGNGPCNKERIAARKKAHSDGEWVRQAASAYAEKMRTKVTPNQTNAA
jgi:ring-1,2-phenylacetyl-CoA epoxidase subunit PaaA